MPGLRADYAWHARCLPASHATHRRRAGVAHPHTRKQDCSSGCAWAMGGLRVGHGQAWPTRGPPVVHPWPRRGPVLGWATPRRDVLRKGKILGDIWLESFEVLWVLCGCCVCVSVGIGEMHSVVWSWCCLGAV